MRVVSVKPLTSLPSGQAEVVDRLGQWPGDKTAYNLRAYWLEDGDVMIAPWNPTIQPGMDVVGVGSVGLVATVYVGERSREATVHWAKELTPRA